MFIAFISNFQGPGIHFSELHFYITNKKYFTSFKYKGIFFCSEIILPKSLKIE